MPLQTYTEDWIAFGDERREWNHKRVDTFNLREFGKFVRLTQPTLCNFCINVASIFSIPGSTVRSPGHAALSTIMYMKRVLSILESAATCPLCSLIASQLDKDFVLFLPKLIPLLVPRSSDVQHHRSPQPQSSSNLPGDCLVVPLSPTTDLVVQKGSQEMAELFSAWKDVKRKFDWPGLCLNLRVAVPGSILEGIAHYYRYLENWYLEDGYLGITIKEFYGTGDQIGGFHLRDNSRIVGEQLNSLRVFTSRVKSLSISMENSKVYLKEAEAALENVAEREVMSNANNLHTLELAKHWITTCYNNHTECNWSPEGTAVEEPLLPSRVIDVSPTQHVVTTPGSTVRLVHSDRGRGKWVALSHRWGKGDVLRLIESNRKTFEEGIDVSSFPATFRDAVDITRVLGLRYLWIDSLCILQDSPSDWQVESAKMPEIYQNAYATIAAAATDSTHGGILVERDCLSSSSKRCILPVIRDGKEGSVTVDVLHKLLGSTEINSLKARAWCFQESQMSRRLLTFDKVQMSFTCLKHGLLESREVSEALAREEKNTFLPALHDASNRDLLAKQRAILITWYQVLADYTSRALTFQEDKLVAISGIAQIIGDFLEDEYHAGLWAGNLPQALLWSPYEEETFPNPPHKATLPHNYRAPSWSWASIESPIAGFLCKMTFQAQPSAIVLDIQIELKGSNKYGQVASGHLEIKGPLRECRVGKALESWPWQPEISSTPPWRPRGNEIQQQVSIGHGIFDIEWPISGTVVWLLQITKLYCLILEHTDNSTDPIFKRLGVAHLSRDPFVRTDETTIIII